MRAWQPCDHSLAGESVLGFNRLSKVHGIVDEGKAGGLVAAKAVVEAEGEDMIACALLHLCNLLVDLSLWHG